MKDTTELSIYGFLKIYDPASNDIFFDGHNAIHYENMSQSLAASIIGTGAGVIKHMAFGNGGTAIDPTGIITYLSPNNVGTNASLYNQTYLKTINQYDNGNIDPTKNYLQFRHVTGANYSDVFITCLLDYGEPPDQAAFDNDTNDSVYIFDELGLVSYSANMNDQLLLSHVVFHPVQKALNRLIQIDYTIRIQSLTGLVGV
jgi:hypothetical protein